jgi:hypothetical protein
VKQLRHRCGNLAHAAPENNSAPKMIGALGTHRFPTYRGGARVFKKISASHARKLLI